MLIKALLHAYEAKNWSAVRRLLQIIKEESCRS